MANFFMSFFLSSLPPPSLPDSPPGGLFISSPRHFSPHGEHVRCDWRSETEIFQLAGAAALQLCLLWSHVDRRAAGWKTTTLFNGASVKMMESSAAQPQVKLESFRETIQPQSLSNRSRISLSQHRDAQVLRAERRL